MMTRRRCTCAVTVGSNVIYVIGGHDGAQILNTIEKYETERCDPFTFQLLKYSHVSYRNPPEETCIK